MSMPVTWRVSRTVASRPLSCSTVAKTAYPLGRRSRTSASAPVSSATATAMSMSLVKRGSARAETAKPPTKAQARPNRVMSAVACRRASSRWFTRTGRTGGLPRHRTARLVATAATAGQPNQSLRRSPTAARGAVSRVACFRPAHTCQEPGEDGRRPTPHACVNLTDPMSYRAPGGSRES
jgi:hypothetical protein